MSGDDLVSANRPGRACCRRFSRRRKPNHCEWDESLFYRRRDDTRFDLTLAIDALDALAFRLDRANAGSYAGKNGDYGNDDQ